MLLPLSRETSMHETAVHVCRALLLKRIYFNGLEHQTQVVRCRCSCGFVPNEVWVSSMWVGVQVSAPQLTLLETVMARMERVDVWILMNGGGGGVNPFQVTLFTSAS